MNNLAEQALKKGAANKRLGRDEALALTTLTAPTALHRLGAAARCNRDDRFATRATYVANLTINPSNICEGRCGFCRYSAQEGDDHAYVLDEKTILERVERLEPVEVHIVGGMNDIWDFDRSLALLQAIKGKSSDIHIKAFTAPEIDRFAKRSKNSTTQVLSLLKDAGLDAMPGGGAEVFSKRMRDKYCPSKISSSAWIDIHQQAHQLGISTNATMLYGLDESWEERIDHLIALREAQDQTGGFSCFIPLAYQPEENDPDGTGPTPRLNLMVTAVSRLVLDNFDHIKAYWPMLGLETAAAALSWGADDLDGTLGEERIAHAAGAKTPKSVTRERMVETISLGGYDPVERDGLFNAIG
jgi:aminodeoxyfutalosine synthase